MKSPVADSYTEFFVGYTISHVVDGIKYPAYRRESSDGSWNVYIYLNNDSELDFDISNELLPVGEYTGTIPNHVYLSTDNISWDFGDGTTKTGTNVRHKYTTPGEFTIRVTLRDHDGRAKISKYKQKIHVADFIKGEVKWETDNIKALRCDTVPAGTPSHSLTIKTSTPYRYNSTTDATHTVSLHVSGSDSEPTISTEYTTYKYAQFDPLWKFMNTSDLNPINEITIIPSTVYIRSYLVQKGSLWDLHYGYYITPDISSTDTTDRDKYTNQSDYYTSVYEEAETRAANPNWKYSIAGHVGYENVRYLDDTAKVYLSRQQDPVMLFASLQISDAYMKSPVVNLEMEPLLAIENWNVDVLPMKVIYNPATALSITPTGEQSLPYAVNKFQHTKLPVNIALVDNNRASILKSPPYPELTDDMTLTQFTSGTDTSENDTDYSLSYPDQWTLFSPKWYLNLESGYGVNLTLQRGFNETIPVSTPGCTNQYIIPTTETGAFSLSATCMIKDFAYANKEVESYFITNMHTDRVFVLRPGYMDKIYRFEPEYVISVNDFLTRVYAKLEEPVNVIGLTDNDPLTHYFSIGVTSDCSAWLADSDLDALIRIDRFGNHIDTIVLPKQLLSDDFEKNIESPITHPGIGQTITSSEQAFSPASISIDSQDAVWVALSERLVVLKYPNLLPDQYSREDPLQIDLPALSGINSDYLKPQKIETDRDDNVWLTVLYEPPSDPNQTHGHSNFYLIKLSPTGDVLVPYIHFAPGVELHDIVVDGYNNLWITDISPQINGRIGGVYNISENGDILKKITNYQDPNTLELNTFDKPAQIIMDMEDNLWVAHRGNELVQLRTDPYSEDQYSCIKITYAGPRWNDDQIVIDIQGRRHAIEGLSCDSDNRILVVNNVSKRLYMFDAADDTRHTWDPRVAGDSTETRRYNEAPIDLESDKNYHFKNSYHVLQAFGDWTGIKWIQKYFKQTNTTRFIHGQSNVFNIVDRAPGLQKINENFGYSQAIEATSLQPTLNNSTSFIDKIIQPAAGGQEDSSNLLGKVTYEKTANFCSNVVDVDVSNVSQLYSLCSQVNMSIKSHNHISPANIKRLVDLFSISYSKMIGSRDETELDFDTLGQEPSINLGKNRGRKLDFGTHRCIAGVPIIAHELFNNRYRFIKPMTIRGDTAADHVSEYFLSKYNRSWGWRLSYPEDEPVEHYYDFYDFQPNVTRFSRHTSNQVTSVISNDIVIESTYEHEQHRQVEGVIDWGNELTTMSQIESNLKGMFNPTDTMQTVVDTASSIIELIIEQTIREGLELHEKS